MDLADFYKTDYLFKPVVDETVDIAPESLDKNINLFKIPVKYLNRFMVNSNEQKIYYNDNILNIDNNEFIPNSNEVAPYPLFNDDFVDFKEVPKISKNVYNCLKDADLFNFEIYQIFNLHTMVGLLLDEL